MVSSLLYIIQQNRRYTGFVHRKSDTEQWSMTSLEKIKYTEFRSHIREH